MKSKKLALLSAVAGILYGFNATAQFTYNNNDLLLGFRTAGGTSDLLVDIGSVSLYTGASGPITISGTYFNTSQLTAAGLSLNNLSFSIFGDVAPGNPTNNGPVNTIWVTSAESPSGTQTTPWSAQNSSLLGTSRSRIESIGNGGNYWGSVNPADSVTNTLTAVITSDSLSLGSVDSYAKGIGPNGNFQGNFGSNNNIENTTGASFASGSTSAISDLYAMQPNLDGVLLGAFQLDPNGTLTFNPTPAPEPTTWAMLGMGIIGLAGWRRIMNRK